MTVSVDSSLAAVAPAPSRMFSARELGELALQLIGAFSPNDVAADPVYLDRALKFMEMEIAHLAATKRCQWLIPATIEFALEADTASYVLSEIVGIAYPSLRIMYPISAWILDDNDNSNEIDIVRRQDYESHSDKDESGTPTEVYLDRLVDDPTITPFPVPSDDTLSLRLVVQTYAPSVLSTVEGDEQAGDVAHGFDVGWQKWIVHQTASVIGNRPVNRLPKADLDDLRKIADMALAELMSGINREKISTKLRRTRRYGG